MSYGEEMRLREFPVYSQVRLAFVLTALTVAALGEAQPGPAVSIRTKVYVDELKPSSGTQKSSLNDFTRQLFQLRFQAVPEIEVAENGEVAPCGDAGSGLA